MIHGFSKPIYLKNNTIGYLRSIAVLLDFFISNSFQKTKGDLRLRLLCRSPMTMPDPLLLFVGVVALCLEGVEGLDGEDDLDLAAPMTV